MTLPWLTPEEQKTWLELVTRNDKIDVIGTGRTSDPPEKRWGMMWMFLLQMKRAEFGVQYRDTTHGIPKPIPVNQSLPYRLGVDWLGHPYEGEQDIPFGIPLFPKNMGNIAIYYEKSGGPGMGRYADLMFLDRNGKLHDASGMIFDNATASTYAVNHYGSPGAFFQSLQMLIYSNLTQEINRVLSGQEAFPGGLGGGGGASPGTEVIGGRVARAMVESSGDVEQEEDTAWGAERVIEDDKTQLISSEL